MRGREPSRDGGPPQRRFPRPAAGAGAPRRWAGRILGPGCRLARAPSAPPLPPSRGAEPPGPRRAGIGRLWRLRDGRRSRHVAAAQVRGGCSSGAPGPSPSPAVKREASDPVPSSSTSWGCMSWGRAPVVLLGGGVSLAPPLPVSKFHRASVPRTACKLKVQGRFPSWCRKGSVSAPAKAPRGAGSWGGCGEAESPPPPCSQATLLLSFLWMPALLPVASRLLLLPRALLSMASGSPPLPSPASGSGYVPGSVSAAFVTCPNEKVAKEIARWGPRRDDRPGGVGAGKGAALAGLWATGTAPGRARSERALD